MRLFRFSVALMAALLIASASQAQQPRQGGGAGGGGFGSGGLASSISRVKVLQDELKVDADQVEKLTAALTKAREDSRELSAKLFNRDTPAEERTEITKKIQEINTKAVGSVLKPEQVKRLHQIENQQAGLALFTREAETLKITDEQKEKIAAIIKELAADRRELMGSAAGAGGAGRRPGAGGAGGAGGNRGPGGAAGGGFGRLDPETTKKLESLQKEALASAVKVLHDDQAATYKEMTGEPFTLPAGALGFGGAGGPGGGFGGGAGGFGTGGFGGFGGGAAPGTILSAGTQTTLKLTDEQKKELEAIQKEVDAKLEKMLTEEQRTQLKTMKDRQANPPAGGGRGNRTPPKKDD
jgi:hypothetical protein